MTLGPRVLKTGMAVTLALYICSIFSLQPAIFAGVAAIFTIQPSIYRSWKHMLDQLQANILGAAIALAALYLFGYTPFTVGLVMVIVITVSLKLKMEATISLTLVTVLAIMSAPGEEDWIYALNRFSIILIGMGSAFLVNILVMPPNYKANYLEKMNASFQKMSLLLRTAISNELTETSFHQDWRKLQNEIGKLKELYKIFDEEREKLSKVKHINARELVLFKQMLKTLETGEELLEIIEEHYFQSHPTERENGVYDAQVESLINTHEHLLLKYEGKVKNTENREMESLIHSTARFIRETVREDVGSMGEQNRLIVVSSGIFQYAFQLQRLNQTIENWRKRAEKEGAIKEPKRGKKKGQEN